MERIGTKTMPGAWRALSKDYTTNVISLEDYRAQRPDRQVPEPKSGKRSYGDKRPGGYRPHVVRDKSCTTQEV